MDEKNWTLRHLVVEFRLAKQVEGKSEKTLSFYGQNLDRILWWLEKNSLSVTSLHQVNAQIIRSFLAYVQSTPNRWQTGSTSSRKPASMSTVDAYRRVFQAFFSWLVKEEIVATSTNPMRKIPRPKVPVKIIQDIPLPLVKRASENCGHTPFILAQNKAIILVLLDTGMRLKACHGISLPSIDISSGLIKVWEKGGEQRLTHLNKTALTALKEYLTIRHHFECRSLWLKEDGTPLKYSAIQSMVRRLRKFDSNQRWTPHTFRNTFAVNLLRGGADTFTLQTLGGWKDLEMPRHYTAALKFEDAVRVHERTSPADRMAAEDKAKL